MKKKQVFTLKNLLYALTLILSVVSICMLFVNALTVTQSATVLGQTVENTTAYTGIKVVFGQENLFGFSFMNLVSYILTLVAVVMVVLKLCNVLKSKIFDYVIVALFVVSAVFFFLTVQFTVWNETAKAALDLVKSTYALGAGAIVSGIASLVSGAMVAFASTRK